MATYNLPAGISADPRALKAGSAAIGVYAMLGDWSAINKTYGRIPDAIADHHGTPGAIRKLIDTGLWAADGDTYVMPDWAPSNKTREQAEKEREQWAARAERARGKAKRALAEKAKKSDTATKVPVRAAESRRDTGVTPEIDEIQDNLKPTPELSAGQPESSRRDTSVTHAETTEESRRDAPAEPKTQPVTRTAGQKAESRRDTSVTGKVTAGRICPDQGKVSVFPETAGQTGCETGDLTNREPRVTRTPARAQGSSTTYGSGVTQPPTYVSEPTKCNSSFVEGETFKDAAAAVTNSRTDRVRASAGDGGDTKRTQLQVVDLANRLVAEALPPGISTRTRNQLAAIVGDTLNAPTGPPPVDAIRTALEAWTKRDRPQPGLLRNLIDDAALKAGQTGPDFGEMGTKRDRGMARLHNLIESRNAKVKVE